MLTEHHPWGGQFYLLETLQVMGMTHRHRIVITGASDRYYDRASGLWCVLMAAVDQTAITFADYY